MTGTNLLKAIKKLGGEATLKVETFYGSFGPTDRTSVEGTLNGYDIEWSSGNSRCFTVRRISQRGEYDPGSDYNPGGYAFYDRIKDLGVATN
mgnify:CR=1 FL=1